MEASAFTWRQRGCSEGSKVLSCVPCYISASEIALPALLYAQAGRLAFIMRSKSSGLPAWQPVV